jgi:hypothetical protein
MPLIRPEFLRTVTVSRATNRWNMPSWLSSAWLIALPCFLALLAYDWIAVVVLGRGFPRPVPWTDLAQNFTQDLALTVIYTVVVTPRILKVVKLYSTKARRACLVMLGLALAWYAVLCAWMTRLLRTPPDVVIGGVLLFVVPMILAPAYVRWLKTKLPGE